MATIGEITSRIRNTIKAVKEDAFVTDRYLWSLVTKYADTLISQKSTKNYVRQYSSNYITLPCVELKEVSKIESCCPVDLHCTIMRTKKKLPTPRKTKSGPAFRYVSTIDGSIELYRIEPGTYASLSKTSTFKYNKQKYYWYLDGYIYVPNAEYESLKIIGLFNEDTSAFLCDTDIKCLIKQDSESNIPDDILSIVESQILKELTVSMSIPSDTKDDNQNIMQ